ncbi:MAG: hypothetical protein IPK29_09445 [Betaproteobacteria bacterium]|nr:hypothetical protein [Betaproteobacteria bacterium]
MDPSAVFAKTPKGLEEVANRTYKLPPRLRALLIMVDGKISAAELAAKAASLGGIVPMLAELSSQGFIAAPTTQAAETVPAGAATGTATATAPRSLEGARRYAIDQILTLLGPNGDPLTERLEKAQSREALVTEGERCRQALRAIAGAQKAERFWEGLSARLP